MSKVTENAAVQKVFKAIVNTTRTIAGVLGQPLLYGGARDLDGAYGYPAEPTNTDYQWMYYRFGVATRVVTIFPDECWKVQPVIRDSEEPDATPFEEALEALDEKASLFDSMHQADQLSGINRYSVIYLGFDDVLAGEGANTIGQPVKHGAQLLFTKVYDDTNAQVSQWHNDPAEALFGSPKTYNINFSTDGSTTSTTTRTIDASRVFHVADKTGPNKWSAEPRMRKVYNRLLDMRKVLGASAEMFWQGGRNGLAVEVDPTASLDATTLAAFKTQLEDYSNNLRRYLSLQGAKIKNLGVKVPDPKPTLDGLYQFIATSLGIPLRIFLGSEQAQLASSQDTANWNSRLALRQTGYINSRMLRPFLNQLIALGTLPTPENGKYSISWQDLDTLSDKEKAEVSKTESEALDKFAGAGRSREIVDTEIFLQKTMGWDDKTIVANTEALEGEALDEDEVAEADAEAAEALAAEEGAAE